MWTHHHCSTCLISQFRYSSWFLVGSLLCVRTDREANVLRPPTSVWKKLSRVQNKVIYSKTFSQTWPAFVITKVKSDTFSVILNQTNKESFHSFILIKISLIAVVAELPVKRKCQLSAVSQLLKLYCNDLWYNIRLLYFRTASWALLIDNMLQIDHLK